MPDLPQWDDLFRIARDEALTRNGRISRAAIERPGMDANILVAACAAIGDEIVGQLASLEAAIFLDSATGQALDRLVYDRYGLVRKPAAASLGTVTFTTDVATGTAFSIPVGVTLQTADGIQFTTTEAVIFPNASTGPVYCAVRSVLAGPDQNVGIGTLTSLVSTIVSQPTDLHVTNALATTGGDAAETDDSLRDRARRFFTTARRGTIGAIEEAALGVGGVQKAVAFEILDSLGRPARVVQLVVADAFTEQFADFSVTPPLYQTQSQLLSSLVFNALADVRAAGIYVKVYVANVVLQPWQLALSFRAGVDVNAAALAARAAIVNYTNALEPGAPINIQDALAALALVPGLAASGGNIISPAGDVVATPLQVIRTSLALVTAVSAQTNDPLLTGSNPDVLLLSS